MDYRVEVIKSRRKTISVEVRPDMRVIVRSPYRMPKKEILKFVSEKQDWIEKHLAKMQEQIKNQPDVEGFTSDEINDLADRALLYFPPRVKEYADIIGVTYGRITIRNQRTRWGSCSSDGNLNFNCLLMMLPEEIRDYVIVHELCHRKEMNHSPKFWKEVEKYCPEYKVLKERLKDEGEILMLRLRK